jgi:hypothetical protein
MTTPGTFNSGNQPVPPYKRNDSAARNDSISNAAIGIAAILCFGGLLLVISVTLIIGKVFYESEDNALSSEQNQVDSAAQPSVSEFEEGYSFMLPAGFGKRTRRETADGDVVYGFSGEDGCTLTFAIFDDKSTDSLYLPSPPKTYAEAIVKSVPELDHQIDGEIQPVHFSLDGMPGVFFRFYEKETYRGVVFTYYMVAVDRGKKLVLKTSGKHGKISELSKSIQMPSHWYDAMMTLRHLR